MGGIEGYKIILTFHSDSTPTTTYLKKNMYLRKLDFKILLHVEEKDK